MFKEKLSKGIACLIALSLLGGIGWAEEKGTETIGTQTIEPELVLEYKSDEPIVDVIFDIATMTVKEAMALGVKGLGQRKNTEIVNVKYPKVVMLKDETVSFERVKTIKFLDKYGEIKKEIDTSNKTLWVKLSKNKEYILVEKTFYPEVSGNISEKVEGIEKVESEVLNKEGKILWNVTHKLAVTYLSPNGKYIVGNFSHFSPEGWGYSVLIYNEKGLVKVVKNERMQPHIDFSKDGSWFAVTIGTIDWKLSDKILEKTGRHGGGRAHHLIVFDEKGNELWRKENIAKGWDEILGLDFPDEIWSLNISNDDIITVITWHVGTNKKIKHCFDKEGNLIETKSMEE
ncbi:MAG: hypothetical protein AB1414_06180 [bacterium]